MNDLYFDYNGTTPVFPEVFRSMRPFFENNFGNPSSKHTWGLKAKSAIQDARKYIATLIGASPEEIYFTSCATEANNMVILGSMIDGGQLAISAIEHPSVSEPAKICTQRSCTLTVLPVNKEGYLKTKTALERITPNTKLVSVMLANNETGTIQPVWELVKHCAAQGILLHTDASQAVGKVPVNVKNLGVDMLTLSGHKIYAPKGIGVLYLRKGVQLPALTFGGTQEKGLRPGTENVPYIVGLGEACTILSRDLESEMARQRLLGDLLLEGLERLGIPLTLHAANTRRLPNTLFLNFWNTTAQRLVEVMALHGIAVSSGASCACQGKASISPVLHAMGILPEHAQGSVRFSWGKMTTEEDMLDLLARLPMVLKQAMS